jgi:predicted DNA-binding transcriptional regulator AlpA
MSEAKSVESLISTKDAAKLMGFTAGHLRNMRNFGGGPESIKVSYNCVMYEKGDVVEWIAQRKRDKIAAIMAE